MYIVISLSTNEGIRNGFATPTITVAVQLNGRLTRLCGVIYGIILVHGYNVVGRPLNILDTRTSLVACSYEFLSF